MKKIGILVEQRFYDQELIYYPSRFHEEGYEVDFLTRLWGNKSLTFEGMNLNMKLEVNKSFENISDTELKTYSAIIVPAGYVADMLRYSERPGELAPAAEFMKRAMNEKSVIKATICHAMWLFTSMPEVIQGRKLTCHNNLYWDVKNAGANYIDQDVVVDDDFLSVRTGPMYVKLASNLIALLSKKKELVGVL